MEILLALKKLGELEAEVGKLYEWMSTLCPADEKAAEFFRKLSADEQSHYDLVKYQERVVRNAPKDFEAVEIDAKAIDRTLAEIVLFRKTSPTLRDAIRFALDLETEIVEHYTATVMEQSNKSFAEVMKSIADRQKDDHYKQLIQFAGSYEQ